MQKPHRGLTLTTLCLAVLIVQIDTSVVNLGVRPIEAYFHAGAGSMQWVVDSYNLVYAVLLLTGGLLADLYGRRLVFMVGAAAFSIASLLCAFSPTVSVLIAGRALTGVGAAFLLPSSLAIIRIVWPDARERGGALGIWAGCNGVALAIGPTAGGFLIRWFGWRSIFLAVIPIGLAALVMALRTVPESSDPEERHFDGPGQVLGAIALGGLALAAIGSHGDAWLATGAGVIAMLALVFFVKVEAGQGDKALVPLDMFKTREFTGAVTATTGMTFGMYGVLFLLPQTWQAVGRLDPVGAGIALIPMALVFVLVSPFSGSLSGKLGTRLVTAGGVGIIGCGLVLIAISAGAASLLATEAGLALTGLGMGLATGPLMGAAVEAVTAERSGTAAALINVARIAGATLGVAVLGTIDAITGGGSEGLFWAMLLGGCVQLSSAAAAWFLVRPRKAR